MQLFIISIIMLRKFYSRIFTFAKLIKALNYFWYNWYDGIDSSMTDYIQWEIEITSIKRSLDVDACLVYPPHPSIDNPSLPYTTCCCICNLASLITLLYPCIICENRLIISIRNFVSLYFILAIESSANISSGRITVRITAQIRTGRWLYRTILDTWRAKVINAFDLSRLSLAK